MLTWAQEVPPALRQGLIETARKSIALRPDLGAGWIALGNLLVESGQFEEAEQVASEAASRLAADARMHLLLANARENTGKIDAALTAAETALALAPDDREVQLRRFDLLVASRRWDRVAGELDAVTATAMARRTVIQAHAHFAFANGNPEALLSLCEAVLARQPGHTFALHQKAVALAMLGRDAEARAVIGIDDFVVVGDLPLQDERIDGGGFLDTLAAEILRNRTLVPDPRGKATRGGLQTRVLVQAGDKAMPLLIAKIRSAVERYVEALPDARHPFVTTRPPLVQLKAWAVVYPQDGRQASHLHPGGWISGVTYITAPRAAGPNAFSGPLVLGALDAERHLDPPPWGTHNIEPMPGRIVLFPSFVPHATEPTGLAEQRICVAFDVEPPQ